MTTLFPVFLKLHSRRVLLVGGGRVAAGKLRALLDAGADVTVVAPSILEEIAAAPVSIARRAFSPKDLNGVWFVVAAGTPDVNREVALCAGQRGIFVNAVDDVQNASAYLGGVLRRDGVTVAVSTDGAAPALAGLLREGLDALLPADLSAWMTCARKTRRQWLADRVPMPERRPRLLDALVSLYPGGQLERRSAEREGGGARGPEGQGGDAPSAASLIPRPPDSPAPRVPGSPAPRLPGSPAPWPPGPPAPRPHGFVALVGAGPGDPELLTRRAASRLAAADLIVYDALVDPRTLELAPAAKRVFVGKRAGRPSVRQDFINRLLVRAARRGLTVVRLKGGDPFVFGRGGEEALALAAAGIAFEVVPGVTSAVAAPALAGIPVTHRGLASGFVVVSGHAADAYRPVLESLAPQSATVVVLMGLRGAASIANLMIDRGWPSGTPVGVVLGGSTADAAAWTTTLAGLRHGIERGDRDGPVTIVIGRVVSLRGLLAALPSQRGSHGNNRTA